MNCFCRDKKDYRNAKQKYKICLDEAREVSYSACHGVKALCSCCGANLNLKTVDSDWLDSPTKIHRCGYPKKLGTRAPNKKRWQVYSSAKKELYSTVQFELYLSWR